MTQGKGVMMMKKSLGVILAAVILFLFSYGCATTYEDKKTRCPKCGSYYDTREGEETFRWMQGR
jgi:hypothetical protein